MEQDTRINPATGFMWSDRRNTEATQNANYVRHSDPAETARDFSRPHTIPADEFEAVTGRNHGEAVREWEKNEEDRIAAEARQAHAA
jgi:hypothetical protein